MATLDQIAALEPEAQDANLWGMMSTAGRYVVYNDAVDLHPQQMRGFASLRAAPEVPAYRELAYDYTNQAWIVNGVYQSCGHPKPCTCFGTVHAGEKPQANADIH